MAKQNYSNINQWKRKNTDRIQILPRKDEHLPERIRVAIEMGKCKSRQEYIISAVRDRLDADGIPDIFANSDN